MTDSWRKRLSLEALNKPLQLQLPFRRGKKEGAGGTPGQPGGPRRRPPSPAPAGATGAPLDLLREVREELEIEPVSGLLVQRPALLRRGLTVGGMVLGASVGICALLLLWHQLLKARMSRLEGIEEQVETLTKDVQGQRAALKKAKEFNESLVKRLTDVRSSSALMAELQARVPEGVQISGVTVKDNGDTAELKVEGLARDPVAFGRVNAMELMLRNSPLIAARAVKLQKAERQAEKQVEAKTAGGITKLELPSAVKFTLTADLAPLAPERLVAVMEGLQAEGMVRRLSLLQKEGLLK